MFRFVVFLAFAAVAHSQYAAPSITTQNQNTYRTYGNLGQVSTFSKSIDTPFSSVSKSDVRVSNPGYAVSAVSPIATHAYASPIAHGYAAPIATYGAPLTQTYASPLAQTYASPLAQTYAAPLTQTYGAPLARAYGAPLAHAYGAPIAHAGYAAAPIAKVGVATGLLGVAYSAAPAVAHMTYSNGLGINYAW